MSIPKIDTTNPVPVVFFRVAGRIIALFPTIPHNPLGADCEGTAPLEPGRTPRSGVAIDVQLVTRAAEAVDPGPELIDLVSQHYGWALARYTAPLDAHHIARRKAAARWRRELVGVNE